MDNSEISQSLNNIANQVSNLGSNTSVGLGDISQKIDHLNTGIALTNTLLVLLIVSIILNSLINWRNKKKN
ncbi:hypothetical protein [Paenibacillus zanthoxyli]|uniref:hypothetical protein n=1 Tax=Paenibacillus zanthoxyli TaxID=369399 RepID=UPI0012EB70EE|nr:hypothetical protein [Paenibacillus zanthoxyli]